MSSPRKTRNSLDRRSRVSRSAWEVKMRRQPSRTCIAKRKSYNESDSDDDATITRQLKRARVSSTPDDHTDSSISHSSLSSSKSSSPTSCGKELDLADLNGAAAKLFNSLPIEIHGIILDFIDSDRDVARYGRICWKAKNAVDALVWSSRYAKAFDVTQEHEVVEDSGNQVIVRYWYQLAADEYKARQVSFNDSWLTFDRKTLMFEPDHFGRQKLWIKQNVFLQHLRNLILESNARRVIRDGKTRIVGKNLLFIQRMTNSESDANYVDILDSLLEPDFTMAPRGGDQSNKTDTLTMIQLCLLPMIFHPSKHNRPVLQLNTSQRLVYSTNKTAPLFKGRYKSRVNLHLLIHTLNFFKFHLKVGNGEGILNKGYSQLDGDQVPQMWPGRIPVGTHTLEGHWRGVTTYLPANDLMTIRTNFEDRESYQDSVDDEDNCVMCMTFFANEDKFGAQHWPAIWDSWLISDPYAMPHPRTKASPQSRPEVKHFWGTSRGLKTGHMFARLHAVHNQGDFHGWQRVVFIKCFEDRNGDFNSEDVWVYEGVVLPGGRVIIGRWMQPNSSLVDVDDALDSGPFLFWNVDRCAAHPAVTPDEAWAFSATIDDPLFQSLPIPEMSLV